jgi:hypothetical protein
MRPLSAAGLSDVGGTLVLELAALVAVRVTAGVSVAAADANLVGDPLADGDALDEPGTLVVG